MASVKTIFLIGGAEDSSDVDMCLSECICIYSMCVIRNEHIIAVENSVNRGGWLLGGGAFGTRRICW